MHSIHSVFEWKLLQVKWIEMIRAKTLNAPVASGKFATVKVSFSIEAIQGSLKSFHSTTWMIGFLCIWNWIEWITFRIS